MKKCFWLYLTRLLVRTVGVVWPSGFLAFRLQQKILTIPLLARLAHKYRYHTTSKSAVKFTNTTPPFLPCFRRIFVTFYGGTDQGGRKPSSAAVPLLRRKRRQYEERATTNIYIFFGNLKFLDIRNFCGHMLTVWVFISLSLTLDFKSLTVIYLFFFIFQDARARVHAEENFHSEISWNLIPRLVFRKMLVRNFSSFFHAIPKLSVFCQPGKYHT